MASACACLIALDRRGIIMGMNDLTRFIIPPVSNLAPLDACAFIILSVSSARIGMNLSDIESIIAISWEGKPSFFKGENMLSKPSVICVGDVVNVKTAPISNININLKDIKTALYTPSEVIFIIHRFNTTLPLLLKSWKIKAKIINSHNALRLSRYFKSEIEDKKINEIKINANKT